MNKIALLSFVVLAFVLFGCGTNEPVTPKTAQQLIDDGWSQYALKNYQGAVELFNQAIALDAGIADAYNGAGWSEAKLDNLNNSLTNFYSGLLKDTANLEIRAGLAYVYNANKDYPQSDSMALRVLGTNPLWVFSRDANISYQDLHLLLAENYFAEAHYDLSRDQVHLLNPAFPADYDVSTLAGRTALAMEIERLRGII